MTQSDLKRTPLSDALVDEILGTAQTADDLFGQDGILRALSGRLMERMLEAELTHHLGYHKHAKQGDIAVTRAMVRRASKSKRAMVN